MVARSQYVAVAQEVLNDNMGCLLDGVATEHGQRREAAGQVVGRHVVRGCSPSPHHLCGIPLMNDCRQPSRVRPRSFLLVVHHRQLLPSYLIPLRASLHMVKPLGSSQDIARAGSEGDGVLFGEMPNRRVPCFPCECRAELFVVAMIYSKSVSSKNKTWNMFNKTRIQHYNDLALSNSRLEPRPEISPS
jgi:hypothetical protein